MANLFIGFVIGFFLLIALGGLFIGLLPPIPDKEERTLKERFKNE